MKKKRKSAPSVIERRKVKAKVMKQLAKAGKESRARKAKGIQNGAGSPAAFASQGNNWWEMRSKHGRDKLFMNPELLWEAACEYFDYTRKNSMHHKIEHKVINGRLKTISTPLVSVLTMEGLCMYMGCSIQYFQTFEVTIKPDDPLRHDFLAILGCIRHTIRNNKFTGAADGTFNAQLIAYDLGLRSDTPAAQSAGVVINISDKEDKSLIDEVKKKLDDLDKEEKDGK